MSLTGFTARKQALNLTALAKCALLSAENADLKHCLEELKRIDDEEINRIWAIASDAEERYAAERKLRRSLQQEILVPEVPTSAVPSYVDPDQQHQPAAPTSSSRPAAAPTTITDQQHKPGGEKEHSLESGQKKNDEHEHLLLKEESERLGKSHSLLLKEQQKIEKLHEQALKDHQQRQEELELVARGLKREHQQVLEALEESQKELAVQGAKVLSLSFNLKQALSQCEVERFKVAEAHAASVKAWSQGHQYGQAEHMEELADLKKQYDEASALQGQYKQKLEELKAKRGMDRAEMESQAEVAVASLRADLAEAKEQAALLIKQHQPVVAMRDHLLGSVDKVNKEVAVLRALLEAANQEKEKLLKDKKKFKYALALEMKKSQGGATQPVEGVTADNDTGGAPSTSHKPLQIVFSAAKQPHQQHAKHPSANASTAVQPDSQPYTAPPSQPPLGHDLAPAAAASAGAQPPMHPSYIQQLQQQHQHQQQPQHHLLQQQQQPQHHLLQQQQTLQQQPQQHLPLQTHQQQQPQQRLLQQPQQQQQQQQSLGLPSSWVSAYSSGTRPHEVIPPPHSFLPAAPGHATILPPHGRSIPTPPHLSVPAMHPVLTPLHLHGPPTSPQPHLMGLGTAPGFGARYPDQQLDPSSQMGLPSAHLPGLDLQPPPTASNQLQLPPPPPSLGLDSLSSLFPPSIMRLLTSVPTTPALPGQALPKEVLADLAAAIKSVKCPPEQKQVMTQLLHQLQGNAEQTHKPGLPPSSHATDPHAGSWSSHDVREHGVRSGQSRGRGGTSPDRNEGRDGGTKRQRAPQPTRGQRSNAPLHAPSSMMVHDVGVHAKGYSRRRSNSISRRRSDTSSSSSGTSSSGTSSSGTSSSGSSSSSGRSGSESEGEFPREESARFRRSGSQGERQGRWREERAVHREGSRGYRGAQDRGADRRGPDRGADRGGPDRGPDRGGLDRGGPDRGPDRGADRGAPDRRRSRFEEPRFASSRRRAGSEEGEESMSDGEIPERHSQGRVGHGGHERGLKQGEQKELGLGRGVATTVATARLSPRQPGRRHGQAVAKAASSSGMGYMNEFLAQQMKLRQVDYSDL